MPVRTPLAADFCQRDNFSTTFWISFIFGTNVGPDLWITWLDFGRFSSWPWPWIFMVKYGICFISGNKKQTYRLNSGPQMWPSSLTFAITLTFKFQGQTWNLLYLRPKWSDYLETKIYRLNSRPQMWPSGLTLAMTLTLIFQGQICNLLYLSPKWSDCHEMKSKHIDWTLGLKCDHQVWPWQWPWSLNFQGQMWPRPLTIRMVLTKDFHGKILK